MIPNTSTNFIRNTSHVPIERHFAYITDKRLAKHDFIRYLGKKPTEFLNWEDLYSFKCVVLLGEGYSGKTHEFKQQNKILKSRDKFSFFVPLELLHDCDLVDTIPIEDVYNFKQWFQETDQEAVFFLDAVDELKLRKGTLRKAIRKIKYTLEPQLHRAKFFISCRPNDWEEELDLSTVFELVVTSERKVEVSNTINGETIFTKVISREGSVNSGPESIMNEPVERVKVLELLPLERNEIVEFANHLTPELAIEFQKQLEEKELWHLYKMPADIIFALNQLSSRGQLGNLEEQLDLGIRQRLKEVSEKKRNSLTEDRALEGAEILALALFLMKRRSIHLSRLSDSVEGLCLADILVDWTLSERNELLGKPLFEQTGVGSFRFHHRSIEEYLAAKKLYKLQNNFGLDDDFLFLLLFADIEKENVIVPNMEPVAAWLSMWNSDIFVKVKERKPLLLFRQGFPNLLCIEQRKDLIRSFVNKYKDNKFRGIGIGLQELKRVASPELGDLVIELWDKAYTGHDTRELILELINVSPLPQCADLAFQAAFDEQLPYFHRILATRTVFDCGTTNQKSEISASILGKKFPERVVQNVLPYLVPSGVNLDEFLELVISLNHEPESLHGLGYALMETVKSVELTCKQKVRIRNGFVQAIWDNRTKDSRIYQTNSSFNHFVDALIVLCSKTIPTNKDLHKWAWSMVIAFHFGKQPSILAKDETDKLQEILAKKIKLREAFFWAFFDLVEFLEAPETFRYWYSEIFNHSLLQLDQNDFTWLLKALGPNGNNKRREVAFDALSQAVGGGENPELAVKILELISDRTDFVEELEQILRPKPQKPNKYMIKHLRRKKEQEAKEIARIEKWTRWREEVLSDQEFLLGKSEQERTLRNLYKTVQKSLDNNSSWGNWNSNFVENAFSSELLEQVRIVLSSYWKKNDVLLFSERKIDERRNYPFKYLIILAAVKCNAEDPEWAKSLSHEEVVKAVRLSTLELNGFAKFLPQLNEEYPDVVENVIVGEVKAQIRNLMDVGEAPILNDLLYCAMPSIQKVIANTIASELFLIENAIEKYKNNDLHYAFKLIAKHGTEDTKSQAVDVIQRYFGGPKRLSTDKYILWLHLMSQLNVELACEKVLSSTDDLSSSEGLFKAISLFSRIFGHPYRWGQPTFDSLETNTRLNLLQKLVIRARKIKNQTLKLQSKGTNLPDEWDYFDLAYNYLLQSLASTQSLQTLSKLNELSHLPEFEVYSDRLKQMATELAAKISEWEPMPVDIFREFINERNYLPYDDLSLFAVMKMRLADFKRKLLTSEFSDIDTLRRVKKETELRNFISNRLDENSRGAYFITQEAVVINENQTDIRLHVQKINKYATIELKLVDGTKKYSARALKNALVEQLVGKYLRDNRSRVGCLLICVRESKRYKHPDTGKLMNLTKTIDWLQEIANGIMAEQPNLMIFVKGIDYSTPVQNETIH